MGTEHTYLADLIRAYLEGDGRPRPAPPDLDWQRFSRLLVEHKLAGTLLPLVAREGLDPKLEAWLDSMHQSFTRSTILRLMHLEKVLKSLRDAGCHPVVLKGAVLATDYYRLPEERYLNDLDILVDRGEVEVACLAMSELGLEFVDTRAKRLYYEKYHFHWILGDETGNIVEIHWDLNLVDSLYRFDLEGLRGRAVPFDLNGIGMRTPEPGDLLLHIVTQSVEGGFFELRHIVDAALILPRIEDSRELARRARRQNMDVALWALMHRLSRWTDVRIPPALAGEIAPRGRSAKLLRRVLDGELLLRRHVLTGHDLNQHFNWLCAPTTRLRWCALRHLLFPGEAHWLEHGAGSPLEARGRDRIRLPLQRLWSLTKLLLFGWRVPLAETRSRE